MTQNKTPDHESQGLFKNRGFKSINQAITTSLNHVVQGMQGKRRVFPTKWKRLNKNLLGGLQPGKMYVIAGRPGVGKSAFSNQLIFDLLDNNKDKQIIVLYWSFEMPGYQQILRMLSKELDHDGYLLGEQFTCADIMLGTTLAWLPELLADHPSLLAYIQRATARPAYQRAIEPVHETA